MAALLNELVTIDTENPPDDYIDEAAMRRCAAVYTLFAERVIR
jgi:hypothetical protein